MTIKALRERKKNRISFRLKKANINKRMRISVYKSGKNMFAQIIDDEKMITLCAEGTNTKSFSSKKGEAKSYNIAGAYLLGQLLGAKAVEAGIKEVFFDRGAYKYHGRVKALADGIREYIKF